MIKLRPWGWEAHCALLLAEKADPKLKDNPLWQLFKADAYEQFHKEMED